MEITKCDIFDISGDFSYFRFNGKYYNHFYDINDYKKIIQDYNNNTDDEYNMILLLKKTDYYDYPIIFKKYTLDQFKISQFFLFDDFKILLEDYDIDFLLYYNDFLGKNYKFFKKINKYKTNIDFKNIIIKLWNDILKYCIQKKLYSPMVIYLCYYYDNFDEFNIIINNFNFDWNNKNIYYKILKDFGNDIDIERKPIKMNNIIYVNLLLNKCLPIKYSRSYNSVNNLIYEIKFFLFTYENLNDDDNNNDNIVNQQFIDIYNNLSKHNLEIFNKIKDNKILQNKTNKYIYLQQIDYDDYNEANYEEALQLYKNLNI